MAAARIVELVQDVILRVVEVLNERCCRLLKRLEYWNTIRRLEGEVSREVDDGIWIELLLRLYMPMMTSRFG